MTLGIPTDSQRAANSSIRASHSAALENIRVAGLKVPNRFPARFFSVNRQAYVGIAPVDVDQFALDFGDLVGVDREGMMGASDRRAD